MGMIRHRTYRSIWLIAILSISSCTSFSNGSEPARLVETAVPGATAAPDSVRTAALDAAFAGMGSPYVWAANGPDGFDCSGLIVWAYRNAVGKNRIFRGERGFQSDMAMDGFYRTGTIAVEPADLAPGDIVFITSSRFSITHGGIFVRWAAPGEIEFINASSYYDAVVIDTIPVDGRVRGQWFAGAGRVLLPTP